MAKSASPKTKKVKAKVIKQNIGVDISKDDFKICFYQLMDNQHRRIKASNSFKNNLAGFVGLMKWIEKKRDQEIEVHITIEATGVYYEQLVYFLNDNGYKVSVVLPNKSKAYAASLNIKTKTDKIDAKMLGQMGLERNLEQWQPISTKMRVLKQLTRDRVTMIDERTMLKNKLHALNHSHEPHPQAIKRMNQRIKLLEKQIEQADKQIEQTVNKDQIIKQHIDNICKTKGLGLVTVATVIAETDGFNLITSRSQLVSYVGYDVVQKESGTSISGKPRISKKGNRFIRRALYFPALSLVKHEPQFKQLYERIMSRTNIKMIAYVAVQRKALLLIYSLFKKNQAYDPNFYKNTENQSDKKEKENIQICRQDANPAYSG